MNTPGKASLPVIKRLPKYYRYLRTLKNDGITSISSRELAAQMGTTASQVRQDFNCIGDVNGRQGIGYSVENLLNIDSKKGKGSRFTVEISMQEAEELSENRRPFVGKPYGWPALICPYG